MPQLDVANSGLGAYAGKHMKMAGITCSALPTRPMAKKEETYPIKPQISPSGLEQKYTDRFDDYTDYSA